MNLKKLQQLIDSVPVAAVITTFDAEEPRILVANKLHQKLTGYTSEELFNASPRLFKGSLTAENISETIKSEMKLAHFVSLTVINYDKGKTPRNINLTICGVIVDGAPYYLALKHT